MAPSLVTTSGASGNACRTLLETLTDDAIDDLYGTKLLTLSLCLTKLYVT